MDYTISEIEKMINKNNVNVKDIKFDEESSYNDLNTYILFERIK